MKREIKFRFWSVQENQMLYYNQFMSVDLIEDESWKVMQYTGLKDKNKKEIYEGDIVITSIHSKHIIEIPDCYFERNTHYDGHELIFEIIGNIHENPELL